MTFVAACGVDPGVGQPCPGASASWVDLSSVLSPADLGIDAVSVAEAFGWGFAAVVLFWFLGYCIGVALAAIRKV